MAVYPQPMPKSMYVDTSYYIVYNFALATHYPTIVNSPMKLKNQILAGIGKDAVTKQQKPVVEGVFLFYMIDSIGYPFDLLLLSLKEKGLGFDVKGFIEAAYKSKNYSAKRIKTLLMEHQPKNCDDFEKIIDQLIQTVYFNTTNT